MMDNDNIGLKDVSRGDAEGRQYANHEMNLAWQYIAYTNVSVFLTGKAGTGKTTFLRKLKERTPKRMVILAPTGVAAINAGGQTIHSFFQLPFGPIIPGEAPRSGQSRYRMSQEKKNIIRTLDLLVIDEISMVRCDLLDAIDYEMRKYRDHYRPFGGVQLLLIGDLQQLSPVAGDKEWAILQHLYDTPYFFGSKSLAQIDYVTVELQHIYRQQDTAFINLLAKIRDGRLDADAMHLLTDRYIPQFVPPAHEDWIRLTTHNRTAQQYNESMLRDLPYDEVSFSAKVCGNFPETNYPADYELTLKVGAQVMFIKNDPSGNSAYYNGKIGIVSSIERTIEGTDALIHVFCKEDGSNIILQPVVWENVKYTLDPDTKLIREEVEGTFRQYPLRLAWAITVHKSQGLTFDHAVLDVNHAFTHGQVYVALSRCRTLQGLVLAQPWHPDSIITDASVNQYMERELSESQHKSQMLSQMKHAYFFSLLDELTDFDPLVNAFNYLVRVVDEHLYTSYPRLLDMLKTAQPRLVNELKAVAVRFSKQYHAIGQSTTDPSHCEMLQARLQSSFQYFHSTLTDIMQPLAGEFSISIGNKQVGKQYNNALDGMRLQLKIKLKTFQQLHNNPQGFTVSTYLEAKAQSLLDDIEPPKKQRNKSKHVSDLQNKGTDGTKTKASKPNTRQVTYMLYKQGMSISDIASERSLTKPTIENHLTHFISSGEIDINDIVPQEHQRKIAATICQFDGAYTLSDIKERLPQEYTYAEIKFTMAAMERISSIMYR